MRRKHKNQLVAIIKAAERAANETRLPQTVWQTNDTVAPFTFLVNGSGPRSDLQPQAMVTLLPEGYFS